MILKELKGRKIIKYMPTKNTESSWKKYMSIGKDIIFILGIIISAVGWIRSETIKSTKNQSQIEVLTIKVNDLSKQIEKQGDILMEQKELNGKIIFFLSTHE